MVQAQSNLYSLVGFRGLVRLVWSATPLYVRFLATPYVLAVYWRILRDSSDLEDLREEHRFHSEVSALFRWARPRYHRVRRILKATYGVN